MADAPRPGGEGPPRHVDDTGAVDDSAEVIDAEVVDAEVVDAEVVDADDGAVDDVATDDVAGQRDEYLDALRRMQADFENYRKRSLRQQTDAIEFATGRLVEELLPVLDACEAGIDHGDQGVTAIFASLLGTLERAGLTRLDPIGEPFDPNVHEAVLHEAVDEGADDVGPSVVEVMRSGYVWKGRILRAAMVKVKG